MKPQIKDFFKFLEDVDGRKIPFNVKLLHFPERITKEDLHVKGNLDLWGTPIKSLPAGLTVGGWLDLWGTQITSLPDGLTVGRDLYLTGTPISKKYAIKQIRKMCPGIKGNIYT